MATLVLSADRSTLLDMNTTNVPDPDPTPDGLTVNAGITFNVSADEVTVRFATTADGFTITNNGTLRNSEGSDDSRAIRFQNAISGPINGTITNTGLLQSDNDALQIQAGTTSSGLLTINNTASGEWISGDGQAIDGVGGTAVTIAVTNAGNIYSALNDSIRFGGVGNLTNTGDIDGGTGASYSGSDGVQYEPNATGTTTNNAGGSISGDRHAINAGLGSTITVINNVGAILNGRNGSGVGSDGTATVTNHGTITGGFSGLAVDGDGDGIDIDLQATIENFGLIEGTGAGGNGSDGLPNTSEGIAAGGGSFTNHINATITGLGLGMLIDDSSQGPATFLTTIINDGTISGTTPGTGIGIRIISNLADTITNNGTITGAGGTAIRFGNGNNTLFVGAASDINGLTDGEGGTNTLNYASFGAAGVAVNLLTGAATGTGGVDNFQNVVGSAGSDTLTGDAGANTLNGNGGHDRLLGGAGANTVTGGAGSDSFVVERTGSTTITDFRSRYFSATLNAAQEVNPPGSTSTAIGTGTLVLNSPEPWPKLRS